MGCNTSQEPATVSVENDAAKADNDINAEVDVKSDSNEKMPKVTENEIPMVNGDPLGKDEGELNINSNLIFLINIYTTAFCI